MDLNKLKNNKYVEELKLGFQDIQTVVQEGNVKLFLKQFVTIAVVVLIWWHLSGKCEKKVRYYEDQVAAARIQQESAAEYRSNKEQLIGLEPRFPDVEAKEDWLLRQILSIFKDAGVTPEVSNTQAEDPSNSSYIAVSLPVNTVMEFNKFAELLASIENRDEFVKVSAFSLEKETDSARLGSNKISMKFNTIFPKEKIAKKLFKDYDSLISARKQKLGAGSSTEGGK